MLHYAITDRRLTGGASAGLLAACLRIAPQVDFLQVRERDWSARELEQFCTELQRELRGAASAPKLLVNHRLDVALALGLDGVHLRSGTEELSPGQAREAYARAGLPPPWVSVSCHTMAKVQHAAQSGASLVLFGPVFGKQLEGAITQPAGTGALRNVAAAAGNTPVLALGGVTPANADECVAAGAAGVAAIRMFFLEAPRLR